MKLEFEYGQGLLGAELPDSTDIFIPGETVADPPCLPQDWDSLYAATLASIRNPIGMPPLKELAGPGKSVVIVIPDIVKGGNQPTSHRKVAIRACLDELYAAGVEQKDVLLLFSNGLHPRATVAEMQTILGPELFGEFYPTGQITSHDSEDYDHLVDLGYTAQGDHVIMNKYVYDADVAVLIGHTQGNPYGGYSGGYKHCATGITHWRSIASHHVPKVMHRADFTPVSGHSLMRTKFDEIGMHMEEKTEEAAALPSLEETVSRDALWSCTTCGACSRACPAGISLPEIIVNMRRHLALEAGDFPEGVANALENTASVGNPWGLDPYERLDWAKDLDVPVAESGVHYDVLYWVGCAASYDRRARKIARSMVRILKATGVNFAVMAEERCHGEFARRLGEEYLYQTAAQENIGNFAQYDFHRILTACPHCFNTLKNE